MSKLYTYKDLEDALDILTGYLTDNVPLPSEGRHNNWEDWYPEIDAARTLIQEHKEKHND